MINKKKKKKLTVTRKAFCNPKNDERVNPRSTKREHT